MVLLALIMALAFDRIDQGRISKKILANLINSLCQDWEMGGLIVFSCGLFLFHRLMVNLSLILGVIFSAMVLIICLGLGELIAKVEEYLKQRSYGDEKEACKIVADLIGRDFCEQETNLTKEMLEGILIEGHFRGLSLLFWYIILGPAGAFFSVLIRHLALCPNASSLSKSFYHLIDWLPARCSALSYGLAGSLTHAITNWQIWILNWNYSNELLLINSGAGALLLTNENNSACFNTDNLAEQDIIIKNALALIVRALLIWVSVVALVVLGSWLK